MPRELPDEETFDGSRPEWLVFVELLKRGLKPGVDFQFQRAVFGGRLDAGGLVVDFWFENPPNLAFSVLGQYFHYEIGGGTIAKDLGSKSMLAAQGITLVFLDELHLEDNAKFYVGEGLGFIDHSRASGGL